VLLYLAGLGVVTLVVTIVCVVASKSGASKVGEAGGAAQSGLGEASPTSKGSRKGTGGKSSSGDKTRKVTQSARGARGFSTRVGDGSGESVEGPKPGEAVTTVSFADLPLSTALRPAVGGLHVLAGAERLCQWAGLNSGTPGVFIQAYFGNPKRGLADVLAHVRPSALGVEVGARLCHKVICPCGSGDVSVRRLMTGRADLVLVLPSWLWNRLASEGVVRLGCGT